ncbi:MAG: hypothetical protein ACR2M6_03785 [Vampirovibrionia bacterium]
MPNQDLKICIEKAERCKNIAEGSVIYYYDSKFNYEWEISAAGLIVRNEDNGVYIYNPKREAIGILLSYAVKPPFVVFLQ